MKPRNYLAGLVTAGIFAASNLAHASGISLDQAQVIALQTAAEKGFISERGTAHKITQIKTIKEESGQPLIYLMQLNHQGFVFVSAQSISNPVLAYGPKNAEQFDIVNNPGIQQWLSSHRAQLKAFQAHRQTPSTFRQSHALKSAKSISPVQPMTTTQWSQNGFYDDQTPDEKLVGCVGTAIAQFLRFHMYPWYAQGGEHRYSYTQYDQEEIVVDFGSSYYYWPWMPDKVTEETDSRHQWEVSQIMYHAGASVNALYGYDVTLAPMRFIPRALEKHFGYVTNGFEYKSDFTSEEWHQMAQNELADNRPFILTGLDPELGIGHAWIVDGYDGDKYHMNWGWGGNMNGYYSIDIPAVRGYTFNQRMAMVRAAPERDLQDVPFCEGESSFTNSADEISDGSHDWNYRLNMNCKILIEPRGASSVTLNFSEFKTERNYDFVTIYNGESTNAPILGKFSGNSVPNAITADSGKMLIHFTSDDIVTEDGWQASYSSQ
ncbi:C10 family peptidase [Aliikangiella coralliicola]|nr:C10 family peptidase [Aliikangiella coralliicola]